MKKKTLQEGELSCVDNHGVRGLKQRWEIYRAWTFVPCMDKTTGTQNSRARRDFPHAAKKNEMLSCVDSHLRTWTTPMDRDKTPCVEKTRRRKCYRTWTHFLIVNDIGAWEWKGLQPLLFPPLPSPPFTIFLPRGLSHVGLSLAIWNTDAVVL